MTDYFDDEKSKGWERVDVSGQTQSVAGGRFMVSTQTSDQIPALILVAGLVGTAYQAFQIATPEDADSLVAAIRAARVKLWGDAGDYFDA